VNDRLTCDEVRDRAAPFVLGVLEADEAAAVRAHLASCQDAHTEMEEMGSVVPALAYAAEEREPRPELKGRILAAAAAERPAHAQAPRPRLVSDATPRRSTAARGPGAAAWGLRIAAVLAIVALAGWNILLQGRLDEADQQALQAAAYGRAVAAVLEVATRPGAAAAVLAPQEGQTGRGIAAVGPEGGVRVALEGLAPTEGSDVYEVWAISGDAQPVPLGHFLVDETGVGSFDAAIELREGDVLALTREPAPGASVPTLPIISLGGIGPASG
jgi:anti-sigma-K factor RskA